MLCDQFSGFSPKLDALPTPLKKNIKELVFCQRQDCFSVTAITRDFKTFQKIIKYIPEGFETESNRFGVDMESLDTDKVRLYHSLSKSAPSSLYGIYWNPSQGIYEEKDYIRDHDGLIIKRKINGVLTGMEEGEVECSIDEWTGPKEIVDVINMFDINTIALKKTHANQTYLRVGEI